MKPVEAVPRVRAEIDGNPLPEVAGRYLSSVLVRRRLSSPALCEITFTDAPPDAGIDRMFRTGATLAVSVGGDSIFSGDVTALEHEYGPSQGYELRVRAYDRLHRLGKRSAVRAHVSRDVAGLAREMADGLGLAVQADASGPQRERWFQYGQSDLEMLRLACRSAGLHFALSVGTLRLMTAEGFGAPIPLTLGDDLLEAHIEVNAHSATSAVTATGWNASSALMHTHRAGRARSGRSVDADPSPSSVGSDGERWLIGAPGLEDVEAEAAAQAALDDAVARRVVFRGVVAGMPAFVPGRRVEIRGVAPSVEGRYVLAECVHSVDERGYLVELASLGAEGPAAGQAPGTGVTLGRVMDVADPEGLGRIRVALTVYEESETDWLPVVVPGAGRDKGLIALPDVDDAVVILFPHGDPAGAFVIGGLYGSEGVPDPGVEGGKNQRYTLTTRAGQKVVLDESAGRVRLENGRGSFVEMAPDRVTVHADADLLLESPGRTITIRGSQIDLERA